MTVTSLSLILAHYQCQHIKEKNKPLTTLTPKPTCEAIKRALGSFTSVKENVIPEISDQQY